jgi:hypothetical protein
MEGPMTEADERTCAEPSSWRPRRVPRATCAHEGPALFAEARVPIDGYYS